MANNIFKPEQLEEIARETVPDCNARAVYRIAWDDMLLQLTSGDMQTTINFSLRELTKSWNDVAALLLERLPPEWQPPPVALPIARDTQFVDELSGG